MDVNKAILSRFSCRDYDDSLLNKEDVMVLKTACKAAPTALNLQDMKYLFIENRQEIIHLGELLKSYYLSKNNIEFINKLNKRGGAYFYNAPLLVLILGLKNQYAPINSGIGSQTLALSACGLGYDSCIMGSVYEPLNSNFTEIIDWREKNNIDDKYVVYLGVVVGRANLKLAQHNHNDSQIL